MTHRFTDCPINGVFYTGRGLDFVKVDDHHARRLDRSCNAYGPRIKFSRTYRIGFYAI